MQGEGDWGFGPKNYLLSTGECGADYTSARAGNGADSRADAATGRSSNHRARSCAASDSGYIAPFVFAAPQDAGSVDLISPAVPIDGVEAQRQLGVALQPAGGLGQRDASITARAGRQYECAVFHNGFR
jgi:hypothetical protein